MRVDSENSKAAWEWAVKHDQVARLDQALDALCRFYNFRARGGDAENACRMAADKLAAIVFGEGPDASQSDAERMRVLARTLTWQSFFLYGEVKTQLLEQSLAILEKPALAEVDTRAERALALYRLAEVTWFSSPEKAAPLVKQSLELYATLGDTWSTARVLVAKAYTVADITEAKRLVKESLALGQALGDRSGENAYALFALAELSIRQGLFQEAENAARDWIAAVREIRGPGLVARGFHMLGYAVLFRGEYTEAEMVIGEGLVIAKGLGTLRYQAQTNIHLGWAMLGQGKYGEARTWGELALSLARRMGKGLGVSGLQRGALELLSSVALAVHENAKALQLLEESVLFAREIYLRFWFPSLLLEFATIRHKQPSQIRRYLYSALQGTTATQDVRPLLYGPPAIALFLADQGEAEQAVEVYALASRYPHVANSCWFEDVCGKPIAAVAATLPPEVVAAAQERGRARDLWVTAQELLEELEAQFAE